MAQRENKLPQPQTAQNPLRITAGSPLAIQGIFLEILRERFASDSELNIVWKEDITETDIVIETGFNEETESRDTAPAVYVTRTSTVPAQIAIGDRAGVSLPDHLEGFIALMTTSLIIECVSNDEGESVIIGDIVQHMLLATSDAIQETFGFHDMTRPTLGQTTPYQRDQTKWMTPVNIGIDHMARWTQVPIAPLIQQIAQRVTMRNAAADDYFIDIVINSLRRGSPTTT